MHKKIALIKQIHLANSLIRSVHADDGPLSNSFETLYHSQTHLVSGHENT